MMRYRTARGEIRLLPPDAAALEICSSDGKLCRVFIPAPDGRITILEPADEEFKRYAKAVKAETAELITFDEKTRFD